MLNLLLLDTDALFFLLFLRYFELGYYFEFFTGGIFVIIIFIRFVITIVITIVPTMSGTAPGAAPRKLDHVRG